MNWSYILEVFYMIMGFLIVATGVSLLQEKDNPKRYGSAAFWFLLGMIFAFGKFLPNIINGIIVVLMGVLSAFKMVDGGAIEIIPQDFRDKGAAALKNKIFIPPATIAVSAFIYATFLPKILPKEYASISGNLSICLAGVTGIIVSLIITKANPKYVVQDSNRLIRTMGPTNILPQLLAALGAVFTASGVGDLIAHIFVKIIPTGNKLAGVIAYCLGMLVFTVIMGNAFAAYTVITIGIGIPFVIEQGANPAIVGAMAITAGYCGTLITPMAANFNIVPANLLETKSQYTVIKFQLPVAITMFIAHIILMYFFGFRF